MPSLEQFARQTAARSTAQQGAMSMAAQQHTVRGEFLVVGPGEIPSVSVEFPVTFIEDPFFYASFRIPAVPEEAPGADVMIGTKLIAGQFPTGIATAYDFIVEERLPSLRLYQGCKIGVVVDGPIGSKLVCSYMFIGLGISNPVS